METQISSSSNIPVNFQHTDNIPENVVSQEQCLSTISQMITKKWHSIVKIVINDFSANAVALINSVANQNCISERIIPTKYYEITKEQLHSARGETLSNCS